MSNAEINAEINEMIDEIGNEITGDELAEPIEVFPVPKKRKPVVIKREPQESEEPNKEPAKVKRVVESLIDVVTGVLSYFDLIDSSDELGYELKDDEFVISDVSEWVSGLLQYIPFIGLMTGGATVARHIASHAASKVQWDETPAEPESISETT